MPVAVVPLWQLAQVPVNAAWSKVADPVRGAVAVLAEAVVETWLADLPVAVVPLWQLAQVPGATPLWLKVAGIQAVVRWQASHEAVVETWFADLPFALVPLWQLAHVPGTTP